MRLVITMSRRYGTGSSRIARELSERLGIPVYDKVYVEEALGKSSYDSEVEVIKELAKEPCIILGRCASEILKDQRNVFNIYICADKEDRIRRIMENDGLSREQAQAEIEKTDGERAEYYYKNTGKTWGDVNNYHMILNTSDISVDQCVDVLIQYFERKELI